MLNMSPNTQEIDAAFRVRCKISKSYKKLYRNTEVENHAVFILSTARKTHFFLVHFLQRFIQIQKQHIFCAHGCGEIIYFGLFRLV